MRKTAATSSRPVTAPIAPSRRAWRR
jgi:hypothetical protein